MIMCFIIIVAYFYKFICGIAIVKTSSARISTQGTPPADFTKVKLRRQSGMNVKSHTDKSGCGITDLVVLPCDLLLLADRDNLSVKLADPGSGQLLDQLQLPDKPWGLCLLPGDRAAVTIPGRSIIQTILVTNKKLSLKSVIKIERQCYGIDYLNDYFVVGSKSAGIRARVALIDDKGKINKCISTVSQGKALFKYPNYIRVTTENTSKVIYVSDWGTKTITRLNEDLQVLQSFTDPGLENPHGLASVGEGQLLVVDYSNSWFSKLSVLDVTTEQFTQQLGQEENLRYTLCVAVSHTLRTVYVNNFWDGFDVIRKYTFK